jgi:hypothetical protein
MKYFQAEYHWRPLHAHSIVKIMQIEIMKLEIFYSSSSTSIKFSNNFVLLYDKELIKLYKFFGFQKYSKKSGNKLE